MRRKILKLLLPLLMSVTLFGCATTSKGISIWPSKASEKGRWNATRISGYQKGEAVMICVGYSGFGDGVARVEVKDAVDGRLVSEGSNFVENSRFYFYTVRGLESGSYVAAVSVEGRVHASTYFDVD